MNSARYLERFALDVNVECGGFRSLREIAVPLGYPPQRYWLGRPVTPTSRRSPVELDEDERHGWTIWFQCAKLFSGSEIDSREGQNRPSEGQKWSPDRPGTAGSGQKHPRSHQNRAKSVPRASQERPRAPQELPRDLQEEPQGRPRDSKRRPGDPRRTQKGLQESQNRD